MIRTISVTQKWQLHIPKEIREIFGMANPGQFTITAQRGKIVLTPHKGGLLSMAGIAKEFAKDKKIDLDNIRDEIDYAAL